MSVWALLPVKVLKGAKARLSSVLSEDERSALARAMLLDVLAALEGAQNLHGIAIVTDDDEAADIARKAGHRVIPEPEAGGLNGALSHGLQALMNDGAHCVFIIHGDVPAVTTDEIEQLVGLQTSQPFVTIAHALSDGGTNGMVLSPPDCIPMLYGKDSANKHVSVADQLDVPVEYVSLEGIGLDVDHPEDLAALIERAPAGATMDYLLASGLDKRVKEHNQAN
jgi:2-phospho-L-lactate/phosphoenolpyruvate guanylyltransferase